jgi:type II secretory pathway component PulL
MNKDAVIREPGKGLTDGMIDLPAEYVILIAKYNNKVDIFRNINENHINKLSNMDYLSKASIDSKLTKTGRKKAVEIKKETTNKGIQYLSVVAILFTFSQTIIIDMLSGETISANVEAFRWVIYLGITVLLLFIVVNRLFMIKFIKG